MKGLMSLCSDFVFCISHRVMRIKEMICSRILPSLLYSRYLTSPRNEFSCVGEGRGGIALPDGTLYRLRRTLPSALTKTRKKGRKKEIRND